ncbi:LysR family transcriptional regulator ArgP [Desulfogranum japonicum]|uniref:LysR family transcriptional regulator ArgP n=1 Tax=Desulfogranum japonicum TaxID=231447 RepID=UPI000416FD59|nr:LysR family transcriptional regulator ArgP [Desulfogranum japonicum]
MLDYKLVEALAMVVREEGFDKAAHALHITQSAVSQRVKLLEEITGQVLITRTSPPQTTTAGQAFLKHYLKVKQLEDDLKGEMQQTGGTEFSSVAVGVNADSLSLWFVDAMYPFLKQERVLLDIRVNDQEQTHQLLKDGEVMACISTQEQPVQGCRSEYLGCMDYRLVAAPDFARQWFPHGFTLKEAHHAPAVIFDKYDALHHKYLKKCCKETPVAFPAHYVPSVEKFADFVLKGLAYGMLPDKQIETLLAADKLIDLSPGMALPVKLYWHCWNLKSELLVKLTRHLLTTSKALLKK